MSPPTRGARIETAPSPPLCKISPPAWGWPGLVTDAEILNRLVALNAERAAEEKGGLIRWLRPDSQNPKVTAHQTAFTGESDS